MKILQIVSAFPPAYAYGGAVKVAYEMSKSLVLLGHEVTVYTTDVFDQHHRYTNKYGNDQMDGINIFRFKNISNRIAHGSGISFAPKLVSAIKANIQDYDIIHSHEYRSTEAVAAYYYAQKAGIPYIIQAHGQLSTEVGNIRLKKIFDEAIGYNILRSAAGLIAVSYPEIKQYLEMGAEQKFIKLIPNGINSAMSKDLPPRGQFREQYGIHEKHIILYVGRIHKIKGIDFLIRAFNFFIQTRTGDDVTLVIIGPDDGYRSVLEGLVEQLGLSDKVRFIGFMSPLVAAYRDADVLVYPSTYEIFGLVPFEALLCGTPVIVTDGCGCGELIKEAECGYLVHYGDVAGLAETLKSALEHPDINKRMVEAGRRYIEEHLTWESVVKQVEEMYEDCVRHV
jgi:glycosyltransferase involved in cell wall biosynthesis